MPVWKYGNNNLTKEDAARSLEAVKSACFGCGIHGNDCPISKTASEIKSMMETEV
jgi:hypothetical protein